VERKTALVVGGGIIGLACAHRLVQEGLAVTVLDPQAALEPPSWGNAGVIAVDEVTPLASRESMTKALRLLLAGGGAIRVPLADFRTWLPFFMRMAKACGTRKFDAGCAALAACMERALPAWRTLLDEIGQREMLIESGHFVVWESKRTAESGYANCREGPVGPVTIRDLTADELHQLKALTKDKVYGGVRFEGTAHLSCPGALLDALRHSLSSAGTTFEKGQAQNIARAGSSDARVTSCDGRTFTGDVVLIAAGIGSGPLMRRTGAVVPIIAERGYHVQSPKAELQWTMPPIFFEDRAVVVTGFSSALRATSFVEFSHPERPATEECWDRLERHVDELGLPFAAARSRWMGARPTLPDYLPAIGRSAFADNLYYAFGHQHLGLTMAAVTAEMVGELVCGREPAVDLAMFDIGRFSRG